MSHLPPQAIDEFQALWKKQYGTILSREDATLRAHQVFSLVSLLRQRPLKQSGQLRMQPKLASPTSDSDVVEKSTTVESRVEDIEMNSQ